MLDITTLFVVGSIAVTLYSALWLIVWRMLREIDGLNGIAIGHVIFAIGLWLTMLRPLAPSSVLMIVASNIGVLAGPAWLADGIAGFLRQRLRRLATIGSVVAAAIFWPISLYVAPDDIAIRIVANVVLSIVILIHMTGSFAGDQSQPRLLRWPLIGLCIAQSLLLVARGADVVLGPAPTEVLFRTPTQTLYFFEFLLFMTVLFFALLLMVGVRLGTDLQARNRELAAALQTEVTLRQEQRQLVNMVSHEFRSPLVAIDRAAEMVGLLNAEPAAAIAGRVERIRESVRRLVGMIDRLLTTESLDQDLIRVEAIDLREVAHEIDRHFGGFGHSSRLRLNLPAAPVICAGDREMLLTILSNLVDNALKYSPVEAMVDIAVRSEGDEAIATVKDSGIGIPPAEVGSVGQRFFRASTTRHVAGTGLGMYIVHRLVARLGGRIRFDSLLGAGTTVDVRLPRPAGG